MDLNQRKLNKNEWDSIEVPVSPQELDVLNLIVSGYKDVNISVNNNKSLLTFLKIEHSEKMEDFLYNKYFAARIDAIIKKYKANYLRADVDAKITIKSADKIRLERNDEERLLLNDIYEFVLISHLESVLRFHDNNESLFSFHYYSLFKLIGNSVLRMNRHIVSMVSTVLSRFQERINISAVVEEAVDIIEKNESLLKYTDMVLYEHQKEVLTVCKAANPKLVLYIAPTGTGKTLTPLALSQKHKVIFVCAARHVGLALARAAISIHKKVAFAFGCSSAGDIRLHYFAAKVYTKNKRTGGIGKVDNSEGSEVEIMICDIKSYLPAMYYMMSFSTRMVHDDVNDVDYQVEDIGNLITYWDEPTITMDYPEHEFHKIIRKNWKENKIPNVVLSSATLPKPHELTETVSNFSEKFDGSRVYSVVSHDCKKSIPIINKDGFVVLPHYLCATYEESQQLVAHCEEHLTLLRYFDLAEVVKFITFVTKNGFIDPRFQFDRYFEQLSDVSMKSIKMYYLVVLRNIDPSAFEIIQEHFRTSRTPRIQSNLFTDPKGNKISKKKTAVNPGIYVTTCDAFTLTDGPTIFISDDVEKIAKFYVQQANIPECVMGDLMGKIEYNNVLNRKLGEIEKKLDEINEKFEEGAMNLISSGGIKGRNKSSKDIKMFNREESTDGSRNKKDKDTSKADSSKLKTEADTIRGMIKSATLNDTFVPNKVLHLTKWAEGMSTTSVFTSNIEEIVVSEIMALDEVDDLWKVLLMMGIGVFTSHKNIKYTEIMKKLADSQKLFMIIASSDYIYGTNYQFCHGYLSKDLFLTQEKIIQALGRVGRNNVQQDYSLRFRDDSQIMKLFTNETEKPEIRNMNILFNSNKIVWDGKNYVPAPEEEEDEEKDIPVEAEEEEEEEDV
jgi:hypothetical protein